MNAMLHPYTLPSRTKPTRKPKLGKEYGCPNRTVEERNNEGTTRYIKHLADSADFKGGTFNKHRNGLIGNRFEMPNVSYTHPLWARVGNQTAKNKTDKWKV
jgi:hypothetical protein